MLGVVTGLAVERDCLQTLPVGDLCSSRCFGPGPKAAEKAAFALVDEGCVALLSFGIAGGLDEQLRPGHVLLAEAVVTDREQSFATDPAWRRRLYARLETSSVVRQGRLLGSDYPLLSRSAKQAASSRYAVVAVDMESHAVGRAARRSGVPFMVMRAVADPFDRAIPAWLTTAIDASGKPRISAVAVGALAHLSDVPQLLRLARDQRAALRALRRAAVDAGPLLACR